MIFTISEDLWEHSYYEIREGKLFKCDSDIWENTFFQHELNIGDFINRSKDKTEAPFPELLAELRRINGER